MEAVMTYDFRPDGLHIVARWPVLARITARHTDAPVLTTRDMVSLYLHAPTGDWWMMGEGEKAFADGAIEAMAAMPVSPSKHCLPKPLDTHNLPPPKHPLPPYDPDNTGW
jgi:hypothetical protein